MSIATHWRENLRRFCNGGMATANDSQQPATMIYFASDIHLGSGDKKAQRATEHRFVEWLRSIEPTAEVLFLVGDIFDFWFEYKRVVPQGFTRTLGQLSHMTDRGIRVVMLTGNHDMWVGKYLTEECGIELYTTPQIFDLVGKRLYISHGDNTNIKGQPMLRLMNAFFRSKSLRVLASWLIHPDLFLRFGQWWSGSSRKAHKAQTELRYLDPLIEFAKGYNDTTIDHFIFGHLHIAHQTDNITFLGNWAENCSWAELDKVGNITLKNR